MFGHDVKIKQKQPVFSNINIPIVRQISIYFHVNGFFFFSRHCLWLLVLLLLLDIFCAICTHTHNEIESLLFSILQFHISLLLALRARWLFFFVYSFFLRRHSFFFSNNSISHLTNTLTLTNNSIGMDKKTIIINAFSFICS